MEICDGDSDDMINVEEDSPERLITSDIPGTNNEEIKESPFIKTN